MSKLLVATKKKYKNIEHKGRPDSLGLELRRPWSRGNLKSEGANGDAIPSSTLDIVSGLKFVERTAGSSKLKSE